MSNDGWGKGWPSQQQPWPESWVEPKALAKPMLNGGGFVIGDTVIGVDISINPDTICVVIGRMKDGILNITECLEGDEARAKIKEYENAVPTHDPYTNPDMCIYHECGCGAILDPNTKSFAELNTAASQVGWKIRWGHEHYKAYCRKCGEGVE